jgi:hypothetical protein
MYGDMNIIILIVISLLLMLVYVVNTTTVKAVKALLNPDELLEAVGHIDEMFFSSYQLFDDWVTAHGYQHQCFFLFRLINGGFLQCAAWWNEEQQTWALIYCLPNKMNIDFVTQYSNEIAVTTASSKDAVLLPHRDKAYLQAFTGLSFDALYAKHLAARDVVEDIEKIHLSTTQQDLFVSLKQALKSQAELVMRLPFWQYRGVYWYFVRRHLKVNKPISKLAGNLRA